MKIGFTGTQMGLSQKQKNKINHIFNSGSITELHHGGCIGADAEAHGAVLELDHRIKIILHPPLDTSKSFHYAKSTSDEVRPAKPYLERNKDIVDETELLVACPAQDHEVLRSGTWATIRYARKKGKEIKIYYP